MTMKPSQNLEMLQALENSGYTVDDITTRTYCFNSIEHKKPMAQEKDVDQYLTDNQDEFTGGYVSAMLWGSETYINANMKNAREAYRKFLAK